MNEWVDQLYHEKGQIDAMIQKIQTRIERSPIGTLKITKKKGRCYYYQRLPGRKEQVIYLPKQKQLKMVKALAQKDYDIKALRLLKTRSSCIETFTADMEGIDLESVYNQYNPDRKALITPLIPSDDQYIETWQRQPYEGRGFRGDDTTSFYTDREERVRSKSEMIIANTLYHAGIPYKYECPLILGRKVFYPDFTLLDVRHRKVLYLEHFGMMDDPSYANQFIRKLDFYQSHGIYPGEQLLMTFESRDQAFDIRYLKQLLDHRLTQTLHTSLDKE